MRTLVILKPDLVVISPGIIGSAIGIFEENRLEVVAISQSQWQPSFWEKFYMEHVDRPMFKSLVKHMASGPCVAMVLDSSDDEHDVIECARKVVIRKVRSWGVDGPANKAHASDSVYAANREIPFFFSEGDIRRIR